MSFLTKLKQDANSIYTRIEGASARIEGYIAIALKFGDELEKFANTGAGRLVIKEVLLKLGVSAAMESDILVAIPIALAYVTQADAVLKAGTPEDQLNAFLQDIENDTEGTKYAKIGLFVEKLVAKLDNNSLLDKVYQWLISHFTTGTALGTSTPVATVEPEVAAPAATVEEPTAEVTSEGANISA